MMIWFIVQVAWWRIPTKLCDLKVKEMWAKLAKKKGSTAIKLHLLPEAVETFYVHTKSRLFVKHAERAVTF